MLLTLLKWNSKMLSGICRCCFWGLIFRAMGKNPTALEEGTFNISIDLMAPRDTGGRRDLLNTVLWPWFSIGYFYLVCWHVFLYVQSKIESNLNHIERWTAGKTLTLPYADELWRSALGTTGLKEVPGGLQALLVVVGLLVGLLADHLYYLLYKALWKMPGHLQTGAQTKCPIRGMLHASDWMLGLEAQSGTDMFRFSRVYKYWE